MIIRARAVVTMTGAPIHNGAIAIDGERIIDLGVFDDVRARNQGDVVDLGERALLPGLINAHCHLDYTCLRGRIPRQTSFADWIRAINAAKAKLSPNDYVQSIKDGFDEARRFGTTTILNLTAFPELISQIEPPIRCLWFPELIDVRPGTDPLGNLTALSGEVSKRPVDKGTEVRGEIGGLGPHALYTASADLCRRCQARAEWVTTHLAESKEEMEMFRDARGALYDFLKSIGRDMSDCDGKTPLHEFVARVGHESLSRWIVVHLNELAPSDFELLAKLKSRFHVVHCPRSHRYFGHSPFGFDRLRDLGFNICLGTDSLASNEDLSLFAEMRAFAENFPTVSPEEILRMVTVNPARSVSRGDLGRITKGVALPFMAVPFAGEDVFEAILGFSGEPLIYG